MSLPAVNEHKSPKTLTSIQSTNRRFSINLETADFSLSPEKVCQRTFQLAVCYAVLNQFKQALYKQ